MIVFITIPWFLPAFRAGGPIQSVANLIENFTVNTEYRIFCADEDLNGEPLTGIVKNEWTNYNSCTKVWYAEKENLSDVLCKEVANIKPDILYIIGLFSWHYNIVPMLFCKADRKIISVRGMLHPGALSQKRVKKQLFLTGLKILGVASKNIFHATDVTEASFIKNEFGAHTKTIIAGNFSKNLKEQLPIHKSPGNLTMVTVALISPMKNHLMVLEALKLCSENIQYTIYGPVKDEIYWQKCKVLMAELPANIKVEYRGEVAPELIESVLTQQHVFIMPSKSENFGHAIAEALSAGKPVITSYSTPWKDLEINRAGINAHTNPSALANAISFFAEMDQVVYNSYVKGSRHYSEQNNKRTETVEAYHQLFYGKKENIEY